MAQNRSNQGGSRNVSSSTREKLSEAGRKGGEAPHRCRGRACKAGSSSNRNQSRVGRSNGGQQ